MLAVGWLGQYEPANMLLDAGADPDTYKDNTNKRLIHTVSGEEIRNRKQSAKSKAEYQNLLQRLLPMNYAAKKLQSAKPVRKLMRKKKQEGKSVLNLLITHVQPQTLFYSARFSISLAR